MLQKPDLNAGLNFCRKMHYPPETASVMIIAQMIATVLQVSPINLLLIHSLINDNDK